ncbi:MAG: hypothetical protein K9N51_12805 [Candidatus Pacebacteria bacterium]|nr:hypothetical protein [Candidatus Paceibacterota bacterium]
MNHSNSTTRTPLAAILLPAACCLILVGCGTFPWNRDKKGIDDLAYIVTLHELADKSVDEGNLVMPLYGSQDGKPIWVRRIPLLTSATVAAEASAQAENKTAALNLQLNPHGQYLWMQLQAQYAGRPVAVAVDGQYRFFWYIPRPTQGKRAAAITIDGPWRLEEVQRIAEYATDNYLILQEPK